MEEVNQGVIDALKVEIFGVITEIDMDKTLIEKINVDMQPSGILGTCNPGIALDAVQIYFEATG
jgi:uncharacterized protein (DUF302 family)